jgi:predicted metal-dependent hydrolase
MRSVQYGSRVINYSILEREELKSHYISVEKHSGVILKGKPVSHTTADKLILKKAKWILSKLELVKPPAGGDITTGSRIPYLGKSYYVEVRKDISVIKPSIAFNHSRFIITVDPHTRQEDILAAIQNFYKQKAAEKITPRVERLSAKTGLSYQDLQYRKMTCRWGSCTPTNRIILNTDAIKLPFTLIDYLIIHELTHTKVKDHSKTFWRELSKHIRNWRSLDDKMKELKM